MYKISSFVIVKVIFSPINLVHVFVVKHTHNYQVLKRIGDPGGNMNKQRIAHGTHSIEHIKFLQVTFYKPQGLLIEPNWYRNLELMPTTNNRIL